MRNRLIKVGIVFAIALALLLGGAIFLMFASPTLVTVRNDSEQTLTEVSVTVQGRRLDFPDLAHGRSARRWFQNTGQDDHYRLLARRSDGIQISEMEGFITSSSLYGSAKFTVARWGVDFEEY